MAGNELLVDTDSNYPALAKLPIGAQYKKQDGTLAFVTQDDINRWSGSGSLFNLPTSSTTPGQILDNKVVAQNLGKEAPKTDRMSRVKALARKSARGALNVAADVAHGVMNYGMSRGMQRKLTDEADTDLASYNDRSGDIAMEQAGRAQKDAQRGYQIANRDQRTEGARDAAANAASQYQQRMAQISGAAGGGAAAIASQNVQDASSRFDTHMNRADTQFTQGMAAQTQSEQAKLNANEAYSEGSENRRMARLRALRNAQSRGLSTAAGADAITEGMIDGIRNIIPPDKNTETTDTTRGGNGFQFKELQVAYNNLSGETAQNAKYKNPDPEGVKLASQWINANGGTAAVHDDVEGFRKNNFKYADGNGDINDDAARTEAAQDTFIPYATTPAQLRAWRVK